jgi:type I restriction enzyme S subunit
VKDARIGDHLEPIRTWNPARAGGDYFEYVDLSAIDSAAKRIVRSSRIRSEDAPSRARQLVSAGDVLVSTVRPNLNAVAVVPPSLEGATASTGFAVLRPSSELDGRYLFHWVRTRSFVNDMVIKATGASYPAVSDRIVKESELPLPRLDEQRRIAAILDAADAIRSRRKAVLAQLETLTTAVFDSEFANVAAGVFLAEAVEDFRYGTSNKAGDSGYPTLRIPNVIGGALSTNEIKMVSVTPAELSRLTLRDGDLLFVRTNGNADNVGRSAIFSSSEIRNAGYVDSPWIYASYLIRARLRHGYDAKFIAAYLRTGRGRAQLRERSKTSAGQFNINIESLGSIVVPAVSFADQQAFATRVAAIDAQRALLRRALAADDELFASLQSRAFSGKL